MMNITVIAVGSLKEKYLQTGCAEYIKRIGAFAKLNMIELDEFRLPDNPSQAQIENALAREGEKIIKHIPKGAAVIALCIEGKEYSSPDFSSLLAEISMTASHICFIIGSSYGLSADVKSRAAKKLSFGKMTLPHQLARLVLLEQTYRAFSILNNSKYHK